MILETFSRATSLVSAATATGAGSAAGIKTVNRTYQAFLSTSTTPAATVNVEASNDGTHWVVLGTITLSGSAATDGFASYGAWLYDRGNVTAISGAVATVTLLRGE